MQGAGGHPLMAKITGQCYRDMQPQVEDAAQQAADNGNVSTGEESAIGQANSSNGSSIAQVTDKAAAQVPAPEQVNTTKRFFHRPSNWARNGPSYCTTTGQ